MRSSAKNQITNTNSQDTKSQTQIQTNQDPQTKSPLFDQRIQNFRSQTQISNRSITKICRESEREEMNCTQSILRSWMPLWALGVDHTNSESWPKQNLNRTQPPSTSTLSLPICVDQCMERPKTSNYEWERTTEIEDLCNVFWVFGIGRGHLGLLTWWHLSNSHVGVMWLSISP